ncbi:S-adenosyl-L-methionine-dependent methyltransferase [Aspergillus cavernicola]|uniref:S-adenosyl-L-methionine-dependent methyltransferase n=1 Tax=Aspergillus cavernicola TaxID=176166 RepID=A0ABR4IX70_9EURO
MSGPISPPDFIEPETSDSDSAFGDTNSTTYTESLRSSFLQSVRENGRGYHKYSDGRYFIPEDEQEQERLDMQHEICLITMDRKLYLSPLPAEVQNVLDIGTGTGIWAIDFADQHPISSVIGTDLSPIQPSWIPPNCKFEIDDYEQPWTFSQNFDFIHGRMLAGSIGDADALFKQAYDRLTPGGWFELQDFLFPVRADDGTMDGTPFETLNSKMLEALSLIGRDGRLADRFKKVMIDNGFENVAEVRYKWPQNGWPKDKHLKSIGLWNMVNTLDGLHGFAARLCIQVLGMSPEELEVLLAGCRKNIQNNKIHGYWTIVVAYGQKPLHPAETTAK